MSLLEANIWSVLWLSIRVSGTAVLLRSLGWLFTPNAMIAAQRILALSFVVCRDHPSVNYEAAIQFSEFLLSRNVQQVIGEFGVERFGQPLFFPRATAD